MPVEPPKAGGWAEQYSSVLPVLLPEKYLLTRQTRRKAGTQSCETNIQGHSSLNHVSRAAGGNSFGQPVSVFTTIFNHLTRPGRESMNENFGVIWTDEISQIEELEEKIAPSLSWDD